jgi:23S rRNA (cytosine1962-C5)-methyltransferase
VDVVSHHGRPLARAAFSPHSQIRARMWSFDAGRSHRPRLLQASRRRRRGARAALPELAGQQGLRLIHGESDGLPGVIADRYGDTVVLQLTSAGAEKWREPLVAALCRRPAARASSSAPTRGARAGRPGSA